MNMMMNLHVTKKFGVFLGHLCSYQLINNDSPVIRRETTLLGHVSEQTTVTDRHRTRAKRASVIQD
jgi:hypothetical protein